MTEVVRTIAALRTEVALWRRSGLRVALVPTMGALHQGHLCLVKTALENADRCVMSIFVNPTQFAPNEDFASYPRREAEDVAAFASAGGHLVFAPTRDEMYQAASATQIKMSGPALGLEQAFRPTHFDGVALVVAKLLLAAQADIAVFGEKDYQQLQVIRRLVADLCIDTEIISGATARDDEGLALSSRNANLSKDELTIARQLNKVMREVVGDLEADASDHVAVLARARASLLGVGFDKLDYLEVRSPALEPWQPGTSGRLLAAVWLRNTRLIDNFEIQAG